MTEDERRKLFAELHYLAATDTRIERTTDEMGTVSMEGVCLRGGEWISEKLSMGGRDLVARVLHFEPIEKLDHAAIIMDRFEIAPLLGRTG